MPKRGGSRGRKKPSLRDLSRQMPTPDEFVEIFNSADTMDARACALVLGALLDNFLEYALRFSFVPLTEGQFNGLFRDPTAPLSSFSAKIRLAHALGVFGDEFLQQIERVRSIRNVFAHAMKPVSFNEPIVAEQCRGLDPQRLTGHQYQPETDTPRERFIATASMLAVHLVKYNSKMANANTSAPRTPVDDQFELQHSDESYSDK